MTKKIATLLNFHLELNRNELLKRKRKKYVLKLDHIRNVLTFRMTFHIHLSDNYCLKNLFTLLTLFLWTVQRYSYEFWLFWLLLRKMLNAWTVSRIITIGNLQNTILKVRALQMRLRFLKIWFILSINYVKI